MGHPIGLKLDTLYLVMVFAVRKTYDHFILEGATPFSIVLLKVESVLPQCSLLQIERVGRKIELDIYIQPNHY